MGICLPHHNLFASISFDRIYPFFLPPYTQKPDQLSDGVSFLFYPNHSRPLESSFPWRPDIRVSSLFSKPHFRDLVGPFGQRFNFPSSPLSPSFTFLISQLFPFSLFSGIATLLLCLFRYKWLLSRSSLSCGLCFSPPVFSSFSLTPHPPVLHHSLSPLRDGEGTFFLCFPIPRRATYFCPPFPLSFPQDDAFFFPTPVNRIWISPLPECVIIAPLCELTLFRLVLGILHAWTFFSTPLEHNQSVFFSFFFTCD